MQDKHPTLPLTSLSKKSNSSSSNFCGNATEDGIAQMLIFSPYSYMYIAHTGANNILYNSNVDMYIHTVITLMLICTNFGNI